MTLLVFVRPDRRRLGLRRLWRSLVRAINAAAVSTMKFCSFNSVILSSGGTRNHPLITHTIANTTYDAKIADGLDGSKKEGPSPFGDSPIH